MTARSLLLLALLSAAFGVGSDVLRGQFTRRMDTVPPSGAVQAGHYLASTALSGAELSVFVLLSTAYARQCGRYKAWFAGRGKRYGTAMIVGVFAFTIPPFCGAVMLWLQPNWHLLERAALSMRDHNVWVRCLAVYCVSVPSYYLIAYFVGRRDHAPRCLKCGYNLTGLTEDRCPECGESSLAETTLDR